MPKEFKTSFFLQNRHIQTVYSSLFRKSQSLNYKIEKFTLSDGDFLECYWYGGKQESSTQPLVILFHGLAGNYKSPYIQGAVLELAKSGFESVIMHFRGCTGNDNLLSRSYHSGETGDALEFARALKNRYPKRELYAAGYSLGANMLLKLLGETGNESPFDKCVAVSPPMDLKECADRINEGVSRYYQHRLVKELNTALQKKYKCHDMQKLIGLKCEDIQKIKTFWEFDDAYTSVIHGFGNAQNYYEKCSSKQFLKNIVTPTLLIHAKDDPFMSEKVIPKAEELSSSIEFELYENGGHVGFIAGSLLNPEFWLEKRIKDYFLEGSTS